MKENETQDTAKAINEATKALLEAHENVDMQQGQMVALKGDDSDFSIELGERKLVYFDEETGLVTTKNTGEPIGHVACPQHYNPEILKGDYRFDVVIALENHTLVSSGKIPTIATDDDFKKDSILMNLEGRE